MKKEKLEMQQRKADTSQHETECGGEPAEHFRRRDDGEKGVGDTSKRKI